MTKKKATKKLVEAAIEAATKAAAKKTATKKATKKAKPKAKAKKKVAKKAKAIPSKKAKPAVKKAAKSSSVAPVKRKRRRKPQPGKKLTPAQVAADKVQAREDKATRRAELKEIAATAKRNANKRHREMMAKKLEARPVSKKCKFVPTEQQRQQVETLAGFGLRHDEICLLIINPATTRPVGADVLAKAFPDELAAGPVKTSAKVAESLFKRATSEDGAGAVPAAIWWTKCRMGWKERVAVDVEVKSGVVVAPPGMTPEEWIEKAAKKAAEAKAPGGDED